MTVIAKETTCARPQAVIVVVPDPLAGTDVVISPPLAAVTVLSMVNTTETLPVVGVAIPVMPVADAVIIASAAPLDADAVRRRLLGRILLCLLPDPSLSSGTTPSARETSKF
jgi:hypothetical protein